jgi:hypothetical protein
MSGGQSAITRQLAALELLGGSICRGLNDGGTIPRRAITSTTSRT